MAIIPDLVDEVSVSHAADAAHHDSDASSSQLDADSFNDDDGNVDDANEDGDSASSSMIFSPLNSIVQPLEDQGAGADNCNMATDHHTTLTISCQQHIEDMIDINPAKYCGPPDQTTNYLPINMTQFRCKKKSKKIKSRRISSILPDFDVINAAGNDRRGLDSTATRGLFQSISKRLRFVRRRLIRSRSAYRKELESSETGSDHIDYNIVASTIYMYREYLADIRRDIDGLKGRIEKQIINSDNLGQSHAPDNHAASVELVEQLPMVHVSFMPCGELRLRVRCAKRDGLITGLILALESDLGLLLDRMNVASHGELIELEACRADSEDALAIGELETIRKVILATIHSAGI